MSQTHPETLPAPLFAVHLQPLHDRLDDEGAVAYAQRVAMTLADTHDPRIAQWVDQHGLALIYSTPEPIVMLAWPDGAVGPARFELGQPVTTALLEAYRLARAVLEGLHMTHAPVAAGTH